MNVVLYLQRLHIWEKQAVLLERFPSGPACSFDSSHRSGMEGSMKARRLLKNSGIKDMMAKLQQPSSRCPLHKLSSQTAGSGLSFSL